MIVLLTFTKKVAYFKKNYKLLKTFSGRHKIKVLKRNKTGVFKISNISIVVLSTNVTLLKGIIFGVSYFNN